VRPLRHCELTAHLGQYRLIALRECVVGKCVYEFVCVALRVMSIQIAESRLLQTSHTTLSSLRPPHVLWRWKHFVFINDAECGCEPITSGASNKLTCLAHSSRMQECDLDLRQRDWSSEGRWRRPREADTRIVVSIVMTNHILRAVNKGSIITRSVIHREKNARADYVISGLP